MWSVADFSQFELKPISTGGNTALQCGYVGIRSLKISMNGIGDGEEARSTEFQADLATIAALVRTTAQQYSQQSQELLSLLRLLEALHKEVRDGLFQDSLPDNRQALYALLRDIEVGGGWPYINRMRLQDFLSRMPEDSEDDRFHPLND